MLDLQCLFWTMPDDTVLTEQTVQCSGVLKNKMFILLQLKTILFGFTMMFHQGIKQVLQTSEGGHEDLPVLLGGGEQGGYDNLPDWGDVTLYLG